MLTEWTCLSKDYLLRGSTMLPARILQFVFIANMVLMIVLASYAYLQFIAFREATEKIYIHPFSVSNAVQSIRTHIQGIHNNLKDIVLAETVTEREQALARLNIEEQVVSEEFRLVYSRYLGDRSDVDVAYELFLSWSPMREEINGLARQGNVQKAYQIIKDQVAPQLDKLEKSLDVLSVYANKKARDVHQKVVDDYQWSLLLLSVLVVIAIMGGLIAFSVFRVQKRLEIILTSHLDLIDQNILIVTLDREAKVIEITSALCRLTGLSIEEVMLKPASLLLGKINSTEEQKYSCLIQAAAEGRVSEDDLLLTTTHGEKRWVHIMAHPVEDASSAIVRTKLFFTDITLEKENAELARTDQLTSLLNRRTFFPLLENQLRIAKRNAYVFELAIIDIDYFKNYNDNYGHPKGDEILVRLAATIQGSFKRADDYVFRLGGEEFAIIYSLSSEELEISDRAEVLRHGIERLQLPHAHSSISPFVTVSIGVARYEQVKAETASMVYREADMALYDAKQKRNCVSYRRIRSIDTQQ